MTDILLAKPKLPPDFIDVSVGEPHLVRDNLIKIFNLDSCLASVDTSLKDMSYPYSAGYQPLVKFLEEKHGAPVIITNGAKQALGAVFYAISKLAGDSIFMRKPYWALIPPLAEMHGLSCSYDREGDATLVLAPNNPDGFMPDLNELQNNLSRVKKPLIHDAAYYTHIYLPRTEKLATIGDAQIFSISKMLGLSGLRLGYVVCKNLEFYKYIQKYIEAMTVGVSITSQKLLYKLMVEVMEPNQSLVQEFEDTCFSMLEENKLLMSSVNPEVLEVPENFYHTPGMFGWFKVGNKADFLKSKINIITGDLFGVPGFVRMNLAFDSVKMKEIINRLNSV